MNADKSQITPSQLLSNDLPTPFYYVHQILTWFLYWTNLRDFLSHRQAYTWSTPWSSANQIFKLYNSASEHIILHWKLVHLLPIPSVLYLPGLSPKLSSQENKTAVWHLNAVCLLIYSVNTACECLVQLSNPRLWVMHLERGRMRTKSNLIWGYINSITSVLTQFEVPVEKTRYKRLIH